MKKEKFSIELTFVFLLINKNVSQLSPNYFQILLDDNNSVIKHELPLLGSVDDFIDVVISEYFKINPEWFIKNIASIEKNMNKINIVYSIKGNYLEHCNRKGKFVNIEQFYKMDMGEVIYGAIK